VPDNFGPGAIPQTTAQVRTQQILGPVGRARGYLEQVPLLEKRHREIQLGVDGVEGSSVVGAELKLGASEVSGTGPTDHDSCRGAPADNLKLIGRG
jgi:hypothetical protein